MLGGAAHTSSWPTRRSGEFMVMDRGKMKKAKNCAKCGLQMSESARGRYSIRAAPTPMLIRPLPASRAAAWRKKWEKNWDSVKYCSDRCRADARRGKS